MRTSDISSGIKSESLIGKGENHHHVCERDVSSIRVKGKRVGLTSSTNDEGSAREGDEEVRGIENGEHEDRKEL